MKIRVFEAFAGYSNNKKRITTTNYILIWKLY